LHSIITIIMNESGNGNGINLLELADRLGQYFIENITSIIMVVIVIIGALVYQQIMYGKPGIDDVNKLGNRKKSQTVIVEPFDNAANDNAANDNADDLDAKLKAGFCKTHLGKPAELETACGNLSKQSCSATSCCVWAKMDSNQSCVSGNQHGPIFKNGTNGLPKTLDYYYFENKCSGNCPE